jgi:hypothetical protein
MEWMSELGELAANEMFAMWTDKITSLIEHLGGKTTFTEPILYIETLRCESILS